MLFENSFEWIFFSRFWDVAYFLKGLNERVSFYLYKFWTIWPNLKKKLEKRLKITWIYFKVQNLGKFSTNKLRRFNVSVIFSYLLNASTCAKHRLTAAPDHGTKVQSLTENLSGRFFFFLFFSSNRTSSVGGQHAATISSVPSTSVIFDVGGFSLPIKFKNSNPTKKNWTQMHSIALLCCFDSRWMPSAAHINVGLSICSRKIPKAKYSNFEEDIFHFGTRSPIQIVIVEHFVYKVEDLFPFPFSLSSPHLEPSAEFTRNTLVKWNLCTQNIPSGTNLIFSPWKRMLFGCLAVCDSSCCVLSRRMGVFMYKSKPLVAKASNTNQ